MKKKIFLLFVISLIVYAGYTTIIKIKSTTLIDNDLSVFASNNNLSTEQQLRQLLDKKDFFQLETLFKEKRSELSQCSILYFEACLQNAFNQTTQSLQTIDRLLDNYNKSLNDTLLHNVFIVKYDNLYKQSRYREATEALKIAIDKYGHATTDSVELISLQEELNAVEPLRKFPRQKIHITTDITIPVSLNQYNHIIISVTKGEQSENFIFDTGSSNAISESSAKRLGIRVLEYLGSTIGATDKKVQFKIGLADKLWIGDLMLENVVFKVIPDELLSFPEANYVIHGIIGFSVINQMKELVIRKNESITVIAHPTNCNLHNLFLDSDMTIVQFEANNNPVLFFMDTGANTSKFSEKYFAANKIEIIENATKNAMRRGGVGGFVNNEVYEMKNVQLKIGGQEMTIQNIPVLTDKLSYLNNYDGHMGQDVLTLFNKLVLNYEDMYLAFDN